MNFPEKQFHAWASPHFSVQSSMTAFAGASAGYRDEAAEGADMHEENFEEGDRKKGRSKGGPENEKRSKDKSKRKESKKRKKDCKREPELGEVEPGSTVYDAQHVPRGESADVQESGELHNQDDLLQNNTGGIEVCCICASQA